MSTQQATCYALLAEDVPQAAVAIDYGEWFDPFGVVTTPDGQDIGQFHPSGSFTCFDDQWTAADDHYDARCRHDGPVLRNKAIKLDPNATPYDVMVDNGCTITVMARTAAEAVELAMQHSEPSTAEAISQRTIIINRYQEAA